jgi:hypothetical protein
MFGMHRLFRLIVAPFVSVTLSFGHGIPCPGCLQESIDSVSLLQTRTDRGRTHEHVCFFVKTNTASGDNDGRARAAVVANTWAAHPVEKSRVFYFVDESTAPYHFPGAVQDNQFVKVISTTYKKLSEKMRQMLVWLNSKRFKDSCGWFALVDDDTYVNTRSVSSKLRNINPSEPHYMGAVYGAGHGIRFVHGSLQVFSAAAVPLIADIAATCDDWSKGSDDVRIGSCIREVGLWSLLPAESFFNCYLNNTRTTGEARPTTLQEVVTSTQTSNSSLDCLDYVHKLLPEDMQAFHLLMRNSPACVA